MNKSKITHLGRNDNTLMILNLDDPRVRDNLPVDHWWNTAVDIARGHELERKFELERAGSLGISDLEEL